MLHDTNVQHITDT